jgi:hypothetical protein
MLAYQKISLAILGLLTLGGPLAAQHARFASAYYNQPMFNGYAQQHYQAMYAQHLQAMYAQHYQALYAHQQQWAAAHYALPHNGRYTYRQLAATQYARSHNGFRSQPMSSPGSMPHSRGERSDKTSDKASNRSLPTDLPKWLRDEIAGRDYKDLPNYLQAEVDRQTGQNPAREGGPEDGK